LFVQIRGKSEDKISNGSAVSSLMDRTKLKTFVALTMDIASASPRRYFFEAGANILNALFHEPLFYFLMSHFIYVCLVCHAKLP
jgi:hypothetical protein